MKRIYEFAYRNFRLPYDTGQPEEVLVRVVESGRVSPCRAIDLGCGTGRNAIYLAQKGFDVTGVDFASSAIGIAKKRAESMGLEVDFVVDDLTSLSHVSGPFQFLVDVGTLDVLHFRIRDLYVRSVNRLIQPGSRYLLDGWEWRLNLWEQLLLRRLGFWGAILEPGEIEKRFGALFEIEEIGREIRKTSHFPPIYMSGLQECPGHASYLLTRIGN